MMNNTGNKRGSAVKRRLPTSASREQEVSVSSSRNGETRAEAGGGEGQRGALRASAPSSSTSSHHFLRGQEEERIEEDLHQRRLFLNALLSGGEGGENSDSGGASLSHASSPWPLASTPQPPSVSSTMEILRSIQNPRHHHVEEENLLLRHLLMQQHQQNFQSQHRGTASAFSPGTSGLLGRLFVEASRNTPISSLLHNPQQPGDPHFSFFASSSPSSSLAISFAGSRSRSSNTFQQPDWRLLQGAAGGLDSIIMERERERAAAVAVSRPHNQRGDHPSLWSSVLASSSKSPSSRFEFSLPPRYEEDHIERASSRVASLGSGVNVQSMIGTMDSANLEHLLFLGGVSRKVGRDTNISTQSATREIEQILASSTLLNHRVSANSLLHRLTGAVAQAPSAASLLLPSTAPGPGEGDHGALRSPFRAAMASDRTGDDNNIQILINKNAPLLSSIPAGGAEKNKRVWPPATDMMTSSRGRAKSYTASGRAKTDRLVAHPAFDDDEDDDHSNIMSTEGVLLETDKMTDGASREEEGINTGGIESYQEQQSSTVHGGAQPQEQSGMLVRQKTKFSKRRSERMQRKLPKPFKLTNRPPILLAIDTDEGTLSAYQCFLRKQIEVFETRPEQVGSKAQGRNTPIVAGQIGIQCKHCASKPISARTSGSIFYSQTLGGLYQVAQNMCKTHFLSRCENIPAVTKEKLATLQQNLNRGSGGKQYWREAAKKIGIIEDDTILKFTPETPLPAPVPPDSKLSVSSKTKRKRNAAVVHSASAGSNADMSSSTKMQKMTPHRKEIPTRRERKKNMPAASIRNSSEDSRKERS